MRRLALVQLERAAEARKQLVEGDREEALHDFRVALRRLRSLLRSHRSAFSVEFPKKTLRRLATLARDTNPDATPRSSSPGSRASPESSSPPSAPATASWRASSRHAATRAIARSSARSCATSPASPRSSEHAPHLPGHRRPRAPSRPPSFAAATREALAGAPGVPRQAGGDRDRGRRVRRPRGTHRRQALRYLAETVAPWIDAARQPVELLRGLQDLLGYARRPTPRRACQPGPGGDRVETRSAADRGHPRRAGIGPAGAASGAAPERSGLIAVARRLGARRARLFGVLAQDWLGESAPRRQELVATLAELDQNLAAPVRRRPERAATSASRAR